MRWVLVVVLLVMTGCGFGDDSGACSTEDGDLVYDLLDGFAQEWDDAIDIARSTGRIALSGPIGELQSIRRDVQRQEWPECATDAHGHLVNWMDGTIDGFLAFMQQKPDSEITGIFEDANRDQEQFFAALRELRPEIEE